MEAGLDQLGQGTKKWSAALGRLTDLVNEKV
jgi:hypothetical protein